MHATKVSIQIDNMEPKMLSDLSRLSNTVCHLNHFWMAPRVAISFICHIFMEIRMLCKFSLLPTQNLSIKNKKKNKKSERVVL